MSECGGTLVIQTQNKDHHRLFAELDGGTLTWARFAALAKRLGLPDNLQEGCEFFYGEDAWDPKIEKSSVKGDFLCLSLWGEEWFDVCRLLQQVEGLASWSVVSNENGYDTYRGMSALGNLNGTVAWDGSSDPEGDEREMHLRWHATMPDEAIAFFVKPKELKKVLKEVNAYRQATTGKVTQWAHFRSQFGHRDGMVLKLRMKGKRARTALRQALDAYIAAPGDEAFDSLAAYMNAAMGEDAVQPRYPNIHPDYPGPREVAEGLCFTGEDGNDLYVGFSVDNIERFSSTDCNASGPPTWPHIANLALFYVDLADSLKGNVYFADGTDRLHLIVHDGYIFLT